MKSKRVYFILSIAFAFPIASVAQTRQPSAPIRSFILKTKQSIADLEKGKKFSLVLIKIFAEPLSASQK